MFKHLPNTYNLTLTFLFSLCVVLVFGQDKANKLFQQNRYAEAAKVFERHVKKHTEDAAAFEKLGLVYHNLRNFRKSEVNFARADALGGLTESGFVNYGQVLIKNGKSEEARDQFERYLKIEPESFVVRLMLQSVLEVEAWESAPSYYTINNLTGINSEYSDFCPVYYQNGLVFTTERNVDHVNENSSASTDLPYLAIYRADFEDEDKLETGRPKKFLTRLYGDYQVGPICIDSNNEIVYFSEVRSTLNKNEIQHIETYSAKIIKNKKLAPPELMPFNSDTFSMAHPSITPDGKTLFFCSNMNGDSGMDLYRVKKNEEGWIRPERLKGMVNTPMNEVFPYAVSEDHIYFASNGHPGYGGLDIFESFLVDGEWTEPINLKAPINSSGDDFGITFISKTKGYFSSERAGGMGRDDIYQFVKLADHEDSARVEVAGVFEFGELPPEGVTIRLLDENDNLLEIVQTDSLGNFAFTKLPTNKDYKIEVEADSSILNGADIYLVNDEGEKVVILDRTSDKQFTFRTLPAESFAALNLMDISDQGMGLYEIFGQLYTELPGQDLAGIKLMILDDEGNVIQETTTDSLGLYAFDQLSKANYYRVKLVGGDSVIQLSSVFYEDGGGIKALKDSSNSLFGLEGLILSEKLKLANGPPTRGYVQVEGERMKNVRVLLLDSNGRHLRASLTDENGMFDFGSLSSKQRFTIILPNEVKQLEGQKNTILVNSEDEKVVYATKESEGLYSFTPLSATEYHPALVSIESSQRDMYGMMGQVYTNEPGDYHDGLQISAVDDKGRIIETAEANEAGVFDFHKLERDVHYNFKVAETDQSNLNVTIFDLEGKMIANLRIDELSNYVFEKLNSDDASMFMLEEADAGLEENAVSGMIYNKLPGDYKPGILVYAVDEEGNVIDSAYTDAAGNFKFENLKRETDFQLQVMDEEDSEMQIGFYNYNNEFEGLVKLDSNNAFTYSKIVLEAAAALGHMEEEDKSGYVYGQVFRKLPGDYSEGTLVYAYDADGHVIDVAKIDQYGKFEFKKLQADENYFIRLEEDDPEANFALLDDSGNVISEQESEGGVWAFDKLAHEEYAMAMILIADTKLESSHFEMEEPTNETLPKSENTAYFDFKSSVLTSEDSAMLRTIVSAMRKDKTKFLKINSHTDQAESMGNWSYSAERSVMIVNYLYNYGISMDRLYVQNWEDSKPIVNCSEGITCTKEQRAQNQRTELALVEASEMPAEPDYLVTFNFNEWQLDDDGEKTVFEIIRFLKSNPNQRVVIDGYADTWGTQNSNQRISELRSININNVLVTNGIDQNRVELKWHGESIPFGECLLYYPCPVDDRNQNRRVEIRVIK